MSSGIPWKELAVAGATTLGVCCAIGWLTGAENLKKKKPAARPGQAGSAQDHQEIELLMQLAEAATKKNAYADAERAYPSLCHLHHSMTIYMDT